MAGRWAWIPFVAYRYMGRGKKTSAAPSSILSILGIATGVLALTVILAVMNGFQLGFIESILEVSSYHIRGRLEHSAQADEVLLERLRGRKDIRSVLPFRELQGLLSKDRLQQAALLRGVPRDTPDLDPTLMDVLDFEAGSFDLRGERSILLGSELARKLSVRPGDSITLISLGGIGLDELVPDDTSFTVAGVFQSGFYEYDAGWAYIPIDAGAALQGTEKELFYGFKLRDRWSDQQALQFIADDAETVPLVLESWRQYNRAFFGALRMEKLLMFVLVALIFVVVAMNIHQAQRRSVLERRDEIGLLRAVGASEFAVRFVFTLDGFFIGLFGSVLGMVPALLIANNIAAFFTLVENLTNGVLEGLRWIFSLAIGADMGTGGNFSVFSPAVFYIKEIPSRVVPHEAVFIFLFGLASATIAAWLASGKVARIQPAEVLRYE